MSNALAYRKNYRDHLAKEFGGILMPSHMPITLEGLCFWVDGFTSYFEEDISGQLRVAEDNSFQNHHLRQDTSSLRPVFQKQAFNNRPALHIANGDKMEAATLGGTAFPLSGTLLLAIEIAYDEQVTPTPLFDNYGTDRNHLFLRPYNQIGIQAAFQKAGNGPYAWVSGPTLSQRQCLLTVSWDTENNIGSMYVDGKLHQSSAIGEQPWQPDQQRVEFWSLLSDGLNLGEAMIFDHVLPATKLTMLHQYLSTKWAIPLQS